MSLAFFSKVLLGTVGAAAVTVPSLAWSNSWNNLLEKKQKLEEEIIKDPKFINDLKEKLKKDPIFLKEMEKEGLKLQYEVAKKRDGFNDENRFCFLFLKQDKLSGIKNSLNTNTQQIKQLISKKEDYLCNSYSEIKKMSENN